MADLLKNDPELRKYGQDADNPEFDYLMNKKLKEMNITPT